MDDTQILSKKVNDKYLKYRNQILEYTNADMNLKLDNEKQVYIALFDIPLKSNIIGYPCTGFWVKHSYLSWKRERNVRT